MAQICKNWSNWLKETRFSYMDETQKQQTLNWLLLVRNSILELASIKEGYKVADFGCGCGLLGFGVLEKFEDNVELIFSDKFQDCLDECKKILDNSEIKSNAKFLCCDLADIKLKNDYLDCAMTRSVLVHIIDKKEVFNELYRVIKPDGCYCAFEPIISENTKYYELTLPSDISDYFDFKKAEKELINRPDDPLVNFSAKSLDEDMKNAGFSNVSVNVQKVVSKYIPTDDTIENWFITPPSPNQKSSKERFLDFFEEKKVNNYIEEIKQALSGKTVRISTNTALIKAVK